MVHIKEPYNRKYNVLSASLNKTFPSFLLVTARLRPVVVMCDLFGFDQETKIALDGVADLECMTNKQANYVLKVSLKYILSESSGLLNGQIDIT